MRSTADSGFPFMFIVIFYSIIAIIANGVACAAMSIKSFMAIPIWLPFVPVALIWLAGGIRGLRPEGLIAVGAMSLVGGPALASLLLSLPASAAESTAIVFSTIRQSLAISIAIMLPLCIVGTLAGVILRSVLGQSARVKKQYWE